MTRLADGGVEATLDYVSPQSKVNLRYVGDGKELNTGVFDRRASRTSTERRSNTPVLSSLPSPT